jgi:hypothetical protein
MNRKQFVLTRNGGFFSGFKQEHVIGRYLLYTGLELEYEAIKADGKEFYLLGSMYDWENPKFSNKENLASVYQSKTVDDVVEYSNQYCGEFILIFKFEEDIYILNDAAAQKEVYYDDTFSCFASQPKLIGLSIELRDHSDTDAIQFYKSDIFKQKCLFVGDSTHKKNVFHLLPNHLLDVTDKQSKRIFPTQTKSTEALDVIARRSANMLKGYITAISLRSKIKMAVTGGYDSRVLFLASLGVNCDYYVTRHPNMSDSHHDVVIPTYLTKLYHKNFSVEVDGSEASSKANVNYSNDIDFPRFLKTSSNEDGCIFINGNISEIARNYYGYHQVATAADLSFLAGYSNLRFAIKQYASWLKSKPIFEACGYHYLDFFYWEEKMGNWAAKSKTELYAVGRDVISPFNSRALLCLLLASNRKDRDSHFNRLYNLIISELANQHKEVVQLPVNPSRKQTLIRLMKRIGIYNLYRYIGVKLRMLSI